MPSSGTHSIPQAIPQGGVFTSLRKFFTRAVAVFKPRPAPTTYAADFARSFNALMGGDDNQIAAARALSEPNALNFLVRNNDQTLVSLLQNPGFEIGREVVLDRLRQIDPADMGADYQTSALRREVQRHRGR